VEGALAEAGPLNPVVHFGFDPRESIGASVFAHSVWTTSPGVAIVPVSGAQGDGTNAFTYARFELFCRSEWSLFVDGSDMLLRDDIRKLWELRDEHYAVQVVKHDYRTKHPRKYVGTEMEADNLDYPGKNQSSVMLINGTHWSNFRNRAEIRRAMEECDGTYLHRFAWLPEGEIGELPSDWNWLCDEFGGSTTAKLLHFTAGIPCWAHYAGSPHAGEWKDTLRRAQRGM
jgi:hypothetical protein